MLVNSIIGQKDIANENNRKKKEIVTKTIN